MTPEAAARQKIDEHLVAAGWAIQDYKSFNPGAARGFALCDSDCCGYLLLVERVPLGVIEATKKGTTLSTASDQSGHYGENLPDFLAALPSRHEENLLRLRIHRHGDALPPLPEQTRIVAEAELCLTVVEELELVAKAILRRSRLLRQSILLRAFHPNRKPQPHE